MTNILIDDFTGTTGDAWDVAKWATEYKTGTGSSSIDTNRGKIVFPATASVYHEKIGSATSDSQEILAKITKHTTSTNYAAHVGVLWTGTGAIVTGSVSQPSPTSGVWIRFAGNSTVGTGVTFQYRASGGNVQTLTANTAPGGVALGGIVWARIQAEKTGADVTLRGRTWPDGSTEPTTWNWENTFVGSAANFPAGAPFLATTNNGTAPTSGSVYFDDVTVDDLQVAAIPVTFGVSPMTVDVAAPNAVAAISKTIATGVATVNVAMPATIGQGNNRVYFPVSENLVNEGDVAYYETMDLSSIAPYSISAGKLRLFATSSSGNISVKAKNNDGTFTDEVVGSAASFYTGMSGSFYTFEVDVTQFAKDMQTGVRTNSVFRIVKTGGGLMALADGGSTQPRLVAAINDNLPASVSVSPSEAMTINLGMISPNVSTTASALVTDTSMEVSVDMGNAILPNSVQTAELIEVFVTAGDAQGIGGTDAVTDQSGPMTAQVEILDPTVTNRTDRVINTGSMAASVRIVGIYYREADRYFKRLNSTLIPFDPLAAPGIGVEDIWYDFRDGLIPTLGMSGTPEHTEGYNQRGAMFFSGDDFIDPPQVAETNISGFPIYAGPGGFEVTIKTTQANGVIFSSQGNTWNLEIDKGYLTIATWTYNATENKTYYGRANTGIKINDGQFHLLAFKPWATIYLDGKVAWKRTAGWSNNGYRGIGRIGAYDDVYAYTDTTNVVVKQPNFVGEMGDIVLRANSGIDDSYKEAFYDWSDALLVKPQPIAGITAEMATDSKAEGNTPRMLVIYGLTTGSDLVGNYDNPYGDPLSGFWIGSNDASSLGRDLYGTYHSIPFAKGTYDAYGYKCYPVHLFMRSGAADGVVKQESTAFGATESYFIDNETGEIRYIDLANDIEGDLSDWDAITVVNWPQANLGAGDGITDTPDLGWYFDPITEYRYDHERERLINGILDASEAGVAVYVGDPRMAMDLGIATGFDAHTPPFDRSDPHSQELDSQLSSAADIYPDAKAAGVFNGFGPDGRYLDFDSINFRRIVSTATDFSEFPTWYTLDFAWHTSYDRLKAYADYTMRNIDFLEDGLSIGAKFPLGVGGYLPTSQHTLGAEPRVIYSLRPDGLVGQVIALEDETFYAGSTLVENSYKDNATTVLIDKGTTLNNGRVTGGRIFVETMDNAYLAAIRQTEASRNFWKGVNAPTVAPSVGWKYVNDPRPTPTKPNRAIVIQVPADAVYDPFTKKWISPSYAEVGYSRWDFDTRRLRESVAEVGQATTATRYSTGVWNGQTVTNKISNGANGDITVPVLTVEDAGIVTETMPLVDMKFRGFNWMHQKPWETEPGAVKVRANAMAVAVTVRDATTKTEKDVVVGVQPMSVRVETVAPPAYKGKDVFVHAFAMEQRVDMNNTQKTFYAQPMVVNVEMKGTSSSSTVEADMYFYLRDEDITLYLGDE